MTLRPYNCIQCSLTSINISLRRVSPVCPFENLPEDEQSKIDGHANVIGDEAVDIKATSNRVEAIEEDDQAKKDETHPCQIWLKGRSEDQSTTVNALRRESLVEHDVGNANRHPCEKSGNRGQVLKPSERLSSTSRASGQIGQG